jgi:hypothetical protein
MMDIALFVIAVIVAIALLLAPQIYYGVRDIIRRPPRLPRRPSGGR